jgi:hypothetical protein
MPAFPKTWIDRARRVDWRVWVVAAPTVATLVATGVIYWLGLGLDPTTHFGAIFASWVSGLVLFLVVGSVVALVSLAKPENWRFESRARILFKRQTGSHIDYIVARIKGMLEHYAERTVIRIAVHSFDAGENKFRVVSTSDITVRSYLDDVQTTYNSTFDLGEVTLPPPGGQSNRLVYLRVNDVPQCESQEFGTEISKPLSCVIDKDSSCQVSRQTEHWLEAENEPNIHRPKRYTQLLTLFMENLTTPGHSLVIRLSRDGTRFDDHQLPPNKSLKLLEVKDVEPGQLAYDFRILTA